MQIVGQSCGACGKAIVAEASARWCGRCRLALHDDCAGEATACPQCGVPFSVSAEVS